MWKKNIETDLVSGCKGESCEGPGEPKRRAARDRQADISRLSVVFADSSGLSSQNADEPHEEHHVDESCEAFFVGGGAQGHSEGLHRRQRRTLLENQND